MTTIRTITTKHADPLGYGEPRLLERLRHMAEDAVNGVNEAAVKQEAAILRARLKDAPHPSSFRATAITTDAGRAALASE